jgi:peptide/nickel transport system permease protein
MRVNDALMAFPAIILALAITAALGPSTFNAVLALSIVYIPRTARIVRASVLVLREMEYVQAAVAAGAGSWRILRYHILPNSMAPLIVQLSFLFAYAVLSEATLSFLGLGAQVPTPDWGQMINVGAAFLTNDPWLAIVPGAAISIAVFSFNLLGDSLRDALDPRLRT